MNLLIRADSSSQIGLGHIMRDLVLAQQYPEASVTFACRDLNGNIIDTIPYPVHVLASDTSEELIECIISLEIDVVVFDHYGIDAAYEKRIKEQTGVTILSMDDTYQPHYCDILYNPNIYAQSQRYRDLVPKFCEIHCAKPLIRDEFSLAKQHPKPLNDAVFISMGGSDPMNLSMQIVQSLPSDTYANLVTTTSNPHLNELRNYAAEHPNIRLHINASNIAALMHECSFAIITPSSIAHEVMFMELPFIAIQSADNQSEFVAYMKRQGLLAMEHFDQGQFQTLLGRLTLRLIPFTELNDAEKEMILAWRNHPDIRMWMLTSNEISLDEHLRFIESLKNRSDKRYFLVRQANDYLGVVDLTDITLTSAEIGIYANPDKRGVGTLLMDALIRYAFNTLKLTKLIANVFSNNEKAKRLYQKFDFTETDRAIHNGKEMITLERTL
ncbi:UDP-2,4-diacetamido-2,4,6-trideoxy-beta-L-altropyranose hydrolase [Sulfuricurvum sp.]|uniref:UDP-2,4-diacetamido-2,4, 6-trideoxy-beta-L-altropyranose hydrolase n=1 Tax=Sulfuricurvum sp. TaxID=2025608 RepID=UPI002D665F8E|nr:UDP-2,4-diacetamido-2,4,6-trideoxy-beta-L-altropyranose hydrolase [Sulfuricurvum sp.]HZF70566.1 UDP-2,4-diacetamido-2,4,6-trideoxy-beta-L-altropyranose hydrolase [Sulfuricurvum sp.]